jgi:aminopeptidase N
MKLKSPFLIFVTAILSLQCSISDPKLTDIGVSSELARYRSEIVSQVKYKMELSVPSCIDSVVSGKLEISFNLNKKGKIILDFTPGENYIKRVLLNKAETGYVVENEHIVINSQKVINGINCVEIEFIAGDQSLNRRDDLLYTLLVPDRARTLFPCFDQPDLKAVYSLTLRIPLGWDALANGRVVAADTLSVHGGEEKEGAIVLRFSDTDPVPTYLFSFVAGRLFKETHNRGGREISIYHRETDPLKVSQCNAVAEQIFDALEWLEEYTAIPYPFEKYDIAIIPGFQYGGMEHTGATLYAARTMFLEKNATIAEEMARAKLIAHETAHMWFGDYVTMKWFNDVWTKEVFANWFAMKIVSPGYPETDHQFNFMNSYIPPAYSEDRTAGTVPVQQPLDNLRNAGLVYGNIIYDKAPVVMDMLVRKVGEDVFREGIREYLKKYAYSNATWDDLIEILDALTNDDLESWSRVWVKEPGMPEISSRVENGKIITQQIDPAGKNRIWDQPLSYVLVNNVAIPNTDGRGYGFFVLDSATSDFILDSFVSYKDGKSELFPLLSVDVTRLSLLVTMYENMVRGVIPPYEFVSVLTKYLPQEQNVLLFGRGINYLVSAYTRYLDPKDAEDMVESCLWDIVVSDKNGQKRTTAFRAFISVSGSEKATETLWSVWQSPDQFRYVRLGEGELTKLSFELMLRKPDKYNEIGKVQLSRITNPDRIKEYKYIMPSLSGEQKVRDSLFLSLSKAENRAVEPWTLAALSYLNHYTRRESSLLYIYPALELLPEIQSTGDIFFPANWLNSLLSGHNSEKAMEEVCRFLNSHEDLNSMLKNKVLQQADHLYRINQH